MCGGGEAELGLVMLAYTVINFYAKTLFFFNFSNMMLLYFVLGFMHVCVFVYRYS